MPKVETLHSLGGNLQLTQIENYVSKIIGNKNSDEINFRFKRNAAAPTRKPRVVKKLIRVNPINQTSRPSNRVSKEINFNRGELTPLQNRVSQENGRRRRRKKIKIKKRKRPLNFERKTDSSKTRRKVIVTRRRLLPQRTDVLGTQNHLEEIIPTQRVVPLSTDVTPEEDDSLDVTESLQNLIVSNDSETESQEENDDSGPTRLHFSLNNGNLSLNEYSDYYEDHTINTELSDSGPRNEVDVENRDGESEADEEYETEDHTLKSELDDSSTETDVDFEIENRDEETEEDEDYETEDHRLKTELNDSSTEDDVDFEIENSDGESEEDEEYEEYETEDRTLNTELDDSYIGSERQSENEFEDSENHRLNTELDDSGTEREVDINRHEESETHTLNNILEGSGTKQDVNIEHLNKKEYEPSEEGEAYETATTEDVEEQILPDYEPFFPELSESLDSPNLVLKTTVLSSTDYETKTTYQSKNRTYTFVVTRVSGDEQIVTSTIEVKPHTKTIIVTEPIVKYTTLTLLDLDSKETLPYIPLSVSPENNTTTIQEGRVFEEARYNLATRIMSNGVEVIVAGDKTTLPGEPDVKRILPSSIYKPVTLKPSTLSDHMMMLMPQDSSNIQILSSSLYPNQFVTKTCLTTFTYLTTYLENGKTAVSSHEQVVSNIATEERNTGKILPTPSMGITLTQYPNLSVGIFPTTYTYLNTILDGEQPLVVTSKHTVVNTVTAPDDYLALLQPRENASAIKDTNTYYSTISLEKTLYEGKESKVVRTTEVITQVVITESVPPRATSIMASYVAFDVEDPEPMQELVTTDVVKTYFVTYTYYNTILDNGNSIIQTNISTSSDVVTEKLYLHNKRTKISSASKNVISSSPIKDTKKKSKPETENFSIYATKTYLTTFTYLTTMLAHDRDETSTIVSSRYRIVENIVTETIEPALLDKKYLNSLRKELKDESTLTKLATISGQKIEITVVAKEKIKPTKVLPIEKTEMPELESVKESLNPNVITGSTIIFFDEEDDPFKQAANKATPTLNSKSTAKNNLNSLLSSEIVTKPSKNTKRHASTSSKPTASPTTPKPALHVNKVEKPEPQKKKQANKINPPSSQVTDLLGLGSININRLQALTPVLNVMADIIQNNLKVTKRNDTVTTTSPSHVKQEKVAPKKKPSAPPPPVDVQNRSPIYIPVGGFTDIEVAESQNIANFQINEQVPWNDPKHGKPTHESPLLNGGIPISPGEVITANSDVIVGKPGRVGPRIPSVTNQNSEDAPLGMKPPPPVLRKNYPKHKHIPVRHEKPSHPILHAPNKDDYIGPPPPPKIPIRPPNVIRGEKHTITNDYIPLSPPPLNYFDNPNSGDSIPNESYKIYEENQPIVFGTPINDYNIKPSVLNEPIVFPEVIERSTGQPLLVNIQPSQVAFVNIPHNRTTALIYGGSTEPHRNGQYFDDPSPYPEPEFSGIESFNNGVPQFASVYNDGGPPNQNQKEVGGVIKVGTQPINIQPPPISVSFEAQPDIRPSKPTNLNDVRLGSGFNKHDIQIQVPPISFGAMQKDKDFNGYIISHGQVGSVAEVEIGNNFDRGRPQSHKEFAQDDSDRSRPNVGQFHKENANLRVKLQFAQDENNNGRPGNFGQSHEGNLDFSNVKLQYDQHQNKGGRPVSFEENANPPRQDENFGQPHNKENANRFHQDENKQRRPDNFGQVHGEKANLNVKLQFGQGENDKVKPVNFEHENANVKLQFDQDENRVRPVTFGYENADVNNWKLQFGQDENNAIVNQENTLSETSKRPQKLNGIEAANQNGQNQNPAYYAPNYIGHNLDIYGTTNGLPNSLRPSNQNVPASNHNQKPSRKPSNQNKNSLHTAKNQNQNLLQAPGNQNHNLLNTPNNQNGNPSYDIYRPINVQQEFILHPSNYNEAPFGQHEKIAMSVQNVPKKQIVPNNNRDQGHNVKNTQNQAIQVPNRNSADNLNPATPTKEIRRPQSRPVVLRPKYQKRPHRPRPKPNNELANFMTPPPLPSTEILARPPPETNNVYPVHQNNQPIRIPLIPEAPHQDINRINNFFNANNWHSSIYVNQSYDEDLYDHKVDDLPNEAGEVVQESNARPLQPGQVPIEILKAKKGTTTIKPIRNNVEWPQNKTYHVNEIFLSPMLYKPRPFEIPVVRPENHQIPFVKTDYTEMSTTRPENHKFVRPGIQPIPFGRPEHQQIGRPESQQTPFIRQENAGRPFVKLDHPKSENQNFVKPGSQHVSFGRPENQQRPFIRPENQQISFARPENQQKPLAIPENKQKPFINAGNQQTQSVRPENQQKPFVRPENQQTNQIITHDVASGVPMAVHGTTYDYPKNHQRPNSNRPTNHGLNDHQSSVINVNVKEGILDHRIIDKITTEGTMAKTKAGTTPAVDRTLLMTSIRTPMTTIRRKSSTVNSNRPKVTSLPIDTHVSTHKPTVNLISSVDVGNVGAQTEKPFGAYTKAPNTYGPTTNSQKATTTKTEPHFDLNIGEISPSIYAFGKNATGDSDMGIMKPPPILRQPNVDMQPPKIEIHSPSGDIYRVPSLSEKEPSELDTQASTGKPYVPKPSENMVPPPIRSEEVVGMNPPPPITTPRPDYKLPSTHKPAFSLELDPPGSYEVSTPASNKPSKSRRPYTRRPTVEHFTSRPIYDWQKPVRLQNETIGLYTTEKVGTASTSPSGATSVTPYSDGSNSSPPNGTQKHSNAIGKYPTESSTYYPVYNYADVQNNSTHKETSGKEPNRPIGQKVESPKIPRNQSTSKDDSFESTNFQTKQTLKERPILTSDFSVEFSQGAKATIKPVSTQERISPTPTVQSNPTTLEVIIGHPNLDIPLANEPQLKKDTSKEESSGVEIFGSMDPLLEKHEISTQLLEKSSAIPEPKDSSVIRTAPTTHLEVFNTGVHHSGNEVKIVDETRSPKENSTRTVISKIIRIRPVSTKYLTYTTTSTVTVTETKIVKTAGGRPVTYTTVVTKTEKITRVDTITEVITLLKPTNIVEIMTKTVSLPSTLYPPGLTYGNDYLRPTAIAPSVDSTVMDTMEDDFIITDTDAPVQDEVDPENDSILVVLTDKSKGSVIAFDSKETQNRDEVLDDNQVNKILIGGISIASVPSLETPVVFARQDKCSPECMASKNELCQKIEGMMRCVCRPGFARMFPDHPCKPTYTYTLRIELDRYGNEELAYDDELGNQNSSEYARLAAITHDGLDRMVMQSDLRDIYHGVSVNGFETTHDKDGLVNNFNLQLSDNTEEARLTDIFKRYLRNNNYSLGGTELYASKENLERLKAEDFNECSNALYNDCSEHAQCFNLGGTYTCSCREGFADLSENIRYPGRICSAEIIGCELCNYHGTCYSRGDEQIICECFQWYAGERCHINLKVLLIALVTLGVVLFTLLLICIILTCCRKRPRTPSVTNGMSFLPQRVAGRSSRRGTLDRRAMIQDTSSESGHSDTTTLPYVAKVWEKPKKFDALQENFQQKPKKLKGALKKTQAVSSDVENGNGMCFPEQKDRSLTVMIPRAKYHPAPPTSPHVNLTTFDKRKTSVCSSNETKLLSYLDAGPTPNKVDQRKYSNAHSESYIEEKPLSRKPSGALISAGFEVSATVVGNNMGTLGTIATTCGTEADRSENATLIQKISADLLSSTGTRSQYNTLRNVLVDEDVIEDPMANWMDTRVTTVSEARSYDETTIQPPTKSFRNDYDSKPSSQHHNDETITMAERDLGSTFLLPHTHLYKPDRGSDISGFESL